MNLKLLIKKLKGNPALHIELIEYHDFIWVYDLEVKSAFRSRGIGSDAMKLIQDYARSNNKEVRLTACAEAGRETDLERFYTRLGFWHWQGDMRWTA